ncbi:hypothetical protein WJX82_004857 [Trebouxia sp. C0006]
MYTPLCTSLQKALPPVSSTTGGLASVIDAALGMLLGSETSGTWPASLSRAATVNTQSAALMQRTDDVLIMGISALAVVVLRLARIHSASQQRQQQPEMALQDRAGTAEVSSSLRRALWHRQRLTVPEYEQLQEHMMAWYANEVWAAGHPSRGRVFQCTDYWCARADKIA